MNIEINTLINTEIKRLQDSINALYNLMEVCATLELPELSADAQYSIYCGGLDIDNPTREDFERVRHTFPAGTKWTKIVNVGATAIDYSTTYQNVTFRCWNTPPPASCRIEYEEVHVPAHIERIPIMICKEGDE